MAIITVVPNTQIAAGGWLSQAGSGSALHLLLADNDLTTYAQSPANPVNATLRLGLADFVPGASNDITFQVEAVQIGNGTLSDLWLELYEGASLRIQRYLQPRALVAGESMKWSFLVVQQERQTVGNWDNVELRLRATGGQRAIRVVSFRLFAADDTITQLGPGQWAFDPTTKMLYIRSADDANPATKTVSVFDWRFGSEEIVMVTTAGNLVGRLCRHFSYGGGSADSVRGASMSYDGSRVVFSSNRGGGQPGIYAVLTDRDA